MSKNIFIGIAWPYVNGDLHIGHLAGYLLPADIFARYHRLIGNNVLMVSGSDCFGTPITVEADKKKVTPKEIVEEYHTKDVDLFLNVLKLSYDLYTKTDHPNHIQQTQDVFIKMLTEGYIYVDKTEQYYSPSENRFLPDRYVVGTCPYCGFTDARSDQCDNCGKLIDHGALINPKSNITKGDVELRESDHYFVDWKKLQPRLEEYVKERGKNWKDWVYQETLGWLKEGLKGRAITRDITWGVPLPKDKIPQDKLITNIENKRIYVWFDAVIGYLSASKLWAKEIKKDTNAWEDFWYDKDSKHYYFMGKDNLVFHTLFWPGQLIIYDEDLHLPDVSSINMFLNLEGKQFSKSRGVSINARDFVTKYGNDAMRFYLTLTMPETKDSSFYWSDFEEKINGVLVANLGNFIHRVLSIGSKVDASTLNSELWDDVKDEIQKAFSDANRYLEKCEFRNYLETILKLSSYGNGIVDREKLWELKNTNETRFNEVLKQLYTIIISLGYLVNPLLFEASDKLFTMLSLPLVEKWIDVNDLAKLVNNIKINDVKPLFSKIELNEDTKNI